MSEIVNVVVAVIENSEGKVLLLRRSPASRWAGNLWNLVSGKIERDERPLDAVVREIQEETQLSVTLLEEYPTYDIEEGGKVWRTYAFRFSTNSLEPQLNEEHTEYAWASHAEILQFELTPLILEDLRRINYIQ